MIRVPLSVTNGGNMKHTVMVHKHGQSRRIRHPETGNFIRVEYGEAATLAAVLNRGERHPGVTYTARPLEDWESD